MGKLAQLLNYKYSNTDERERLLARNNFDATHKKFLLKGTEADVDELIISTVGETVNQGAQERRLFRDILPLENTQSFKFKNTFEKNIDAYGEEVAEAGSIPVRASAISGSTYEVKKFGAAANITRNFFEDYKFNTIELEVKNLGQIIENTINRETIGTLLEDHNGTTPTDVDPAGAKIAISDLGLAYEKIVDLHYRPSHIILNGKSAYWLTSGNSSNLFDYARLMNLDISVCHDEPDSNVYTKYWDDNDAASHYNAIVMDADKYGKIYIKRDITVQTNNNWKSIETGLLTLAATVRFKVVTNDSQACCRIFSK
jgi:hypothetical protein